MLNLHDHSRVKEEVKVELSIIKVKVELSIIKLKVTKQD